VIVSDSESLISQKVFIKSFCKKSIPAQIRKLVLDISKIKELTNLCGYWFLQNNLINAFCEIKSLEVDLVAFDRGALETLEKLHRKIKLLLSFYFSCAHWVKDAEFRCPWPESIEEFDPPVRAGGTVNHVHHEVKTFWSRVMSLLFLYNSKA